MTAAFVSGFEKIENPYLKDLVQAQELAARRRTRYAESFIDSLREPNGFSVFETGASGLLKRRENAYQDAAGGVLEAVQTASTQADEIIAYSHQQFNQHFPLRLDFLFAAILACSDRNNETADIDDARIVAIGQCFDDPELIKSFYAAAAPKVAAFFKKHLAHHVPFMDSVGMTTEELKFLQGIAKEIETGNFDIVKVRASEAKKALKIIDAWPALVAQKFTAIPDDVQTRTLEAMRPYLLRHKGACMEIAGVKV